MKRAVLSLSGGMDSTGLLIHFLANGYKVSALSFDYGQKHKLELERLADNLAYLKEKGYEIEHTVLDVSQLGNLYDSALVTKDTEVPEGFYEEDNMKATVVPNRNMIFFSMIAGYALSIANREDCQVDIGLGVHSGDHAIYPDCRPEFYVEAMNAFKVGNWDSEKVSLKLPYLDGDKETILKDSVYNCHELNLDFDIVFANTNTSYAPDEKGRANGKTGSDVERILAFHAIGRRDPVEYVGGWDYVLENALNLQQEFQENK
jgi:7-cyano-7-deazaguanine synthase